MKPLSVARFPYLGKNPHPVSLDPPPRSPGHAKKPLSLKFYYQMSIPPVAAPVCSCDVRNRADDYYPIMFDIDQALGNYVRHKTDILLDF